MISDRRNNVRTPIEGERRAVLATGLGDLAVMIIDESVGGYGILAPDTIALVPDARAFLLEDGRSQAVRIAHVRRADVHLRVGLELVSDEVAKRDLAEPRRKPFRIVALAAVVACGLLIDVVLHGWWF